MKDGWITPDDSYYEVRSNDLMETHESFLYQRFGLFLSDAFEKGWIKVRQGYFMFHEKHKDKVKYRPQILIKQDGSLYAEES